MKKRNPYVIPAIKRVAGSFKDKKSKRIKNKISKELEEQQNDLVEEKTEKNQIT